jgi:tetratricopeptide (TPR) repeat protein
VEKELPKILAEPEYRTSLSLKHAIQCCDKAIQIEPKHANALATKGKVFLHINKLGEAIGCFKRSLEIELKNVLTQMSLSEALLISGAFKEGPKIAQ